MAEPNPSRGEVALPFGDGRIILRADYTAIGKLIPLLLEATPEVLVERHKWLTIGQEQFGPDSAPPPLDRWKWYHHLWGAAAVPEVDVVARAVAILAAEHHPDLTVDQVLAESPPFGVISRVLFDLARVAHWRPGQEPEEVKALSGDPLALVRISRVLTRLLRPTASVRPNSGA